MAAAKSRDCHVRKSGCSQRIVINSPNNNVYGRNTVRDTVPSKQMGPIASPQTASDINFIEENTVKYWLSQRGDFTELYSCFVESELVLFNYAPGSGQCVLCITVKKRKKKSQQPYLENTCCYYGKQNWKAVIKVFVSSRKWTFSFEEIYIWQGGDLTWLEP